MGKLSIIQHGWVLRSTLNEVFYYAINTAGFFVQNVKYATVYKTKKHALAGGRGLPVKPCKAKFKFEVEL